MQSGKKSSRSRGRARQPARRMRYPEPVCRQAIVCQTGGWTYSHIADMVCHMKTTLNIDDTVMDRLRREAARQRKTMSELVEAALRQLFRERHSAKKKKLPALPTFNSGGFLVDIADRDALYDVLDREHDDLYRH